MKTKSILFCFVFALGVNLNTANAQVNVQDSLALVDLYDSTDGPNWKHHDNWLTSNPISTWYGIKVIGARVTSIDLNLNKLKGSIPSSIGDLINLTVLNLSSFQIRHLSGSIPSSIGNLLNLQTLDLSGNGLSGGIPSSIGNLLNLQTLDLSENPLGGSIPSSIGDLVNLETLSLKINELSGSIPSSIGNLVNLQKLLLSYNRLSGTIPSSIGNLVNLRELDLYGFDVYNNITGNIPSSIGNLVNLHKLDLSFNKLSGEIPFSIGDLVNLDTLILGGNLLNDTIPVSIGNLVNLRYLDLGNNQFSGVPSSIGNLINLTILGLYDNQLSGNIPAFIGNLVNLRFLSLGDNQFSGSIPSSIGNLVSLNSLYLNNNKLSDSIPSSLGNLINLQYLFLDNNQLSGNIPAFIGDLVNLEKLSLYGNQLSGSIPSSIGNLVHLHYLYLSNNQLTDSIPSSIGNLVALLQLTLNNNQLSGYIPSSFSNLNGLRDFSEGLLRLNSNHFTFDGMELIAQLDPHCEHCNAYWVYGDQADIHIHQNGNLLSVYAGGTLSHNTYYWFSVGQNHAVTITGDSVFHPSQSGYYFAGVNNSICTKLTLHTDTIFYDAALPVTIIDLKAQQQKSIIKIDWTSVTEINVADYEIQRSSNALNFSTVGTLTAKGNGTQKVNYTFNDVQPLHGDNYYHIKAVDKDGKTTYSNTVLVKMNNDKIITVVYPNPAKDILHVETNGSATFSLIDQSGKILITTNITGKGIINISGIAAGLYYLKNNLTENVQKVVIAR